MDCRITGRVPKEFPWFWVNAPESGRRTKFGKRIHTKEGGVWGWGEGGGVVGKRVRRYCITRGSITRGSITRGSIIVVSFFEGRLRLRLRLRTVVH